MAVGEEVLGHAYINPTFGEYSGPYTSSISFKLRKYLDTLQYLSTRKRAIEAMVGRIISGEYDATNEV